MTAAAVLAAAAAAAASPPADWAPDVAAAREFAAGRTGEVSFHVRTEAERWGLDPDRGVASASVIKAMLMVAYLKQPSVRARELRAADRRLLGPMIRRSDNVAGGACATSSAIPPLRRLARQAGMTALRDAPGFWGLLADHRARPDAHVAALRVCSSRAAIARPR